MYVKWGGELRDGEVVTDIIPGQVVIIMTSKTQYKARSVVLTVGPWATKLLPRLGIHIPLEVNIISNILIYFFNAVIWLMSKL
jgi:glycine/D-amino acid oxidase-like deaminating enzyme